MRLLSVQRCLWAALLAFFVGSLTAQTLSPVATLVQNQRDKSATFPTVKPFTVIHTKDQAAAEVAPNAQFLTLHDAELQSVMLTRPEALTLVLPYHGELLTVDLVRSEVTSDDFTVLNEREAAEPYLPGVHYRGVLRDDNHSVAAISFFDDEIMGLVANDEHGNLVLGRLVIRGNTHQYILYSDAEMSVKNAFNCGTTDEHDFSGGGHASATPDVNGCVRVFLEVDNELFVEKGSSVQSTVNYLLGVYNQLATLYTNEQISTVVSQMLIWTTPDFYSTSSSATVLDQFRTFRTSFNGDLAHLVGTGGANLGGIAYLGVLCQSAYNRAYSDITGSYNTVPTYSWTVEVMTHEMGHNLGSHHTQWCGWSGGPIDGCVTAEGGCANGPAPSGGGTIMSYCHLTSYGINFNNGFGTQPGNVIRNKVSTATCLAASCATPSSCGAPSNITVSGITGTSATVGWAAVSGATGYTLRYRAVGGATWNSITNASNPYNLSGLPTNDEVEVTVQSVCGSAVSDFRFGTIFKTGTSGGGSGGGGNTTCGAPANLAVQPSSSSATVTWGAVSGAASYSVSWKLSTAATWSTPSTVTSSSFTINSLAASSTYNVRVLTNCSNGLTSAYTTTNFTTTASGGGGATCGTPTNLGGATTSTGISASWTGVSGATSYSIQWKLTTASAWGTAVTTANTSYNIAGLAASTTYNVRVRALCSSTSSGYITTNFTTQSSGGNGGGGSSCALPAGLAVTSITNASVRVYWNASQGAMNYNLQIKPSTATTWFTFSGLPATIVTVQGLTAATTYNVRISSNCAGGASSGYTNILNFTTSAFLPPAGPDSPDNLPVDERGLTLNFGDALPVATLALAPNPATDYARVLLDLPDDLEVSVNLLDGFGRLVHTQTAHLQSGALDLNLSTVPAGFYVVQALADGVRLAPARLVKQK